MSTRGVIARQFETGFVGRYHHFDSYPEGLGKALWNLYHGYFQKDLQTMLIVLIDDHPAGWSTIVQTDFQLTPGYDSENEKRPQCYCHGERSEKLCYFTEKHLAGSWIEYVYVFNNNQMSILDGKKSLIAVIDLHGEEPNWKCL